MSTKCTIYYQAGKVHGEDNDYLHVYWDMGAHQPPGLYVDTAGDRAKVEDPEKLLEALQKFVDAGRVRDRSTR